MGSRSLAVIVIALVLVSCGKPEHRAGQKDTPAAESPQTQPARTAAPASQSARTPPVNDETNPPTTSTAFRIRGQVLTPDGKPASSATVHISYRKGEWQKQTEAEELGTKVTGRAGHFHCDTADRAGLFGLRAVCSGYAAGFVEFHQDEKGALHEVAQVIRLRQASCVRGRVTDLAGRPVPSASVRATILAPPPPDARTPVYADTTETTADVQGAFALEDVTSGELELRVSADGYVPATWRVIAPAENRVFALDSTGAEVAGHVYQKPSGEPVSSATVVIESSTRNGVRLWGDESFSTQTGEDGEFRFVRLPAGRYDVSASTAKLRMLPEQDTEINVAAHETTSGSSLFLYPGHTIQGVVRDKSTSKSLEGVKLQMNNAAPDRNRECRTGPDGSYRFDNVFGRGNCVFMSLQKKGYYYVPTDTRRPFQIMLDPLNWGVSRDYEMAPAVLISGRVETVSGLAVAGAKVHPSDSMRGDYIPVTSDEKGEFVAEVQPSRKLRFVARSAQYGTGMTDELAVEDKPLSGVVITLQPDNAIAGRVVGPDDMPVQSAKIEAQLNLGAGRLVNLSTTASDGGGQFTFETIPNGRVTFKASKTGFLDVTKEIGFAPGAQIPELLLRLGQSHHLAGKVMSPDGKPLMAVWVEATGQSRARGCTATNAEGRYRLEGLEAGKVSVYLSYSEESMETKDIDVDRDDADFVFRKRDEITLIGKVVDNTSGEPVKGLQVRTHWDRLKIQVSSEIPGQFTCTGLRKGDSSVQLEISAPGYVRLSAYARLTEDTNVVRKTFRLGHGATVKGRSVLRSDKTPLAGVRVQLRIPSGMNNQDPSWTAVTATDGVFRFEGVSPGYHSLEFMPPAGLGRLYEYCQMDNDRVFDLGDVEFGSAAAVRGRVVRIPGETGIPSVRVELVTVNWDKALKKATETDSDGRFEFDDAESCSLWLPEYNKLVHTGAKYGEVTEVVIPVGQCRLVGTALRGDVPCQAQVRVSRWRQNAAEDQDTDAHGVFIVDGLTPGEWEVTITPKQGGAELDEWISIPDQRETRRAFALPTTVVTGRVVDSAGVPVAGATVWPQDTKQPAADFSVETAITGSDGSFTFTKLRPGSWGFLASKQGAGSSPAVTMDVPAAGNVPPVQLRLTSKTGTLVCITLDSTDGRPIFPGTCRLIGASGEFLYKPQVSDEGVLTISDVPEGMYEVIVGGSLLTEARSKVQIKAGETIEVRNVVTSAGSFFWVLQDRTGNPVSGAECRLTPNDPNSLETARQGMTGPAGIWVASGILPGQYTGTASVAGKPAISVQVSIRSRKYESVVTRVP